MTDIAALTHRLADTAIEQSELYKAAKRDAEEAEAYAAALASDMNALADMLRKSREYNVLLEAKLAKAVEALRECEADIDGYIWHEYPGDHPVQARYRKRDFDANPARIALAELRGQNDE